MHDILVDVISFYFDFLGMGETKETQGLKECRSSIQQTIKCYIKGQYCPFFSLTATGLNILFLIRRTCIAENSTAIFFTKFS